MSFRQHTSMAAVLERTLGRGKLGQVMFRV